MSKGTIHDVLQTRATQKDGSCTATALPTPGSRLGLQWEVPVGAEELPTSTAAWTPAARWLRVPGEGALAGLQE